MTLKKWIIVLITTTVLMSLLVGLFNTLVDPFGIFGDKIMDWPGYNITNNPRTAKIGYLDEHYEAYDSYIIGCSKTSSISPLTLNDYYDDASFYNLMMYGGDLYDIEMTTKYVVDNYNVKNIIINIGLEEAVAHNVSYDKMKSTLHGKVDDASELIFYGKYFFMNPRYSFDKIFAYFEKGYLPNQYDVFIPELGVYNKVKRDIEAISDTETYMMNNPSFSYNPGTAQMLAMDKAVQSIANTKAYCESRGINYQLIVSPVSDIEFQIYDAESLKTYFTKIAEVTDYWNFSGYNDLSHDYRYYYDTYHFRNVVGDMMLAKIFDDDSLYIPREFGRYVTSNNVSDLVLNSYEIKDDYTKQVPILMYHHIEEGADQNTAVVTPDKFKKDMKTFKAAGFTTIFYEDLVNYVELGIALPEKPLIISFDDGYESNYTFAYPILKELDMKATVSVVGISVGKDVYKDTDHEIIPHFTIEEGIEMIRSGVIDLQNHSYEMHDVKTFDGEGYRYGALIHKTETVEAFKNVLTSDYDRMTSIIEDDMQGEMFVYTYPYGKYDDLTEVLLQELGNKITVTIDYGINEVIKGLPQSLLGLKRINVTEDLSGEQVIQIIEEF